MAFLAAATPYISAAATIGSQMGNANAQQQIADIQAKQLHKQSLADKALAVQDANHERRKAELLKSRVRALSGKSGTAYESVDIQNTVSDIDEQGEYNALAALHSGFSAAGSKNYAATVATARGNQARSSGYSRAAGTILNAVDKKYA